jgi:hypothetical protein
VSSYSKPPDKIKEERPPPGEKAALDLLRQVRRKAAATNKVSKNPIYHERISANDP